VSVTVIPAWGWGLPAETLRKIAPQPGRRQMDRLPPECDPCALDQESSLLANTADDNSRKVFEPAVKGKTDRLMLRFRRPVK
jgi:Predicted methyltransferase